MYALSPGAFFGIYHCLIVEYWYVLTLSRVEEASDLSEDG